MRLQRKIGIKVREYFINLPNKSDKHIIISWQRRQKQYGSAVSVDMKARNGLENVPVVENGTPLSRKK